jgi:hypothetical protein
MTERLLINDREFKVTRSLDQALRRIRRKWHRRALWVDQVCINQDDLAERSTQVLLMGRIYSSAQKVLSWLGEPPPFSGLEQRLKLTTWMLIGLSNGQELSVALLDSAPLDHPERRIQTDLSPCLIRASG